MNATVARLKIKLLETWYSLVEGFWNAVLQVGAWLVEKAKGHVRRTYYDVPDRYDRTGAGRY